MKNAITFLLLFLFAVIHGMAKEHNPLYHKDQLAGKKGVLAQPIMENQLHGNSLKANGSMNFGNSPEWNWSYDFGGAGSGYANEIRSDTDGNLYLTGSFSGEIAYGDSTYTAGGLRDAFVAKFDANDELVWFLQINAARYNHASFEALHLDKDGYIYATGYYTGQLDIAGNSLPGENSRRLFFVKMDQEGAIMLSGYHDTEDKQETGKVIKTDLQGNIYILADHDVLKYDKDGNLVWEIEENEETFHDFEILGNELFFVGEINSFEGRIDTFSYSGGAFVYNDMFLARSGLDGHVNLIKLPGHGDSEGNESRGYSIALGGNNNLYVSGYFRGELSLDSITLTSGIHFAKVFILKLDSLAQTAWGTALEGDRVSSRVAASDEGHSTRLMKMES